MIENNEAYVLGGRHILGPYSIVSENHGWIKLDNDKSMRAHEIHKTAEDAALALIESLHREIRCTKRLIKKLETKHSV